VIAVNAGEEGGVVVQRVRELTGNDGYDAVSGTYGDLVSKGVIDPTKVVISALTNAASIATLLLTTEALVAEVQEKDEPASAGHSHGGGMGGLDDDMDF
jgi:chaperonin GroEL